MTPVVFDVVVRKGASMIGRVVVGVDGSERSRHALVWALHDAALRRSVLEEVIVWQHPYDFERYRQPATHSEMGEEYQTLPSLGRRDRAMALATTDRLEEVVSGIARESAPIEIERRVLEGDPAAVLCDLAAGAELLVGSRGHGTVAGLLLGSVISAWRNSPLALHAPVSVQPDERR